MIARIYVAGPYTKGDVAVNVRNAYDAANRLADLGFAPFVPHATHFWHMLFPRPYEFWLDLDNQFLPCCEAVLRLPGPSSGADKEVELARTLGIPVFTEIHELAEHFGYFLFPSRVTTAVLNQCASSDNLRNRKLAHLVSEISSHRRVADPCSAGKNGL